MAHLLKYLLYKHKDLNLEPHYPLKKLDTGAQACNPSAEEMGTGSQGHLASQST